MFINATTLAQLFGVSRASAYELMSEKNFPSFGIGKRILVTKEKLVEWIFPKPYYPEHPMIPEAAYTQLKKLPKKA